MSSQSEGDRIARNEELFLVVRKRKDPQKLDKIEKLLSDGADINFQNANHKNNTVLHIAVEYKDLDLAKFLLKKCALTDRENSGKQTPLDIAKEKNYVEIVKLLEDHDDTNYQPQPKKIRLHQTDNSDSSLTNRVLTTNKKYVVSKDKKLKTTLNVGLPSTYPASGLKSTLHGNIYQLKLLLLFLKRGLDNGYNFLLATEMDSAEKFDDLVFKYVTKDGIVIRFLQAKHKQSQTKKVLASDLLSLTDGDFSLKKYFFSYLKIINNPEFNAISKEFIICTNANFDILDLKSKNIELVEVTSDDYVFEACNEAKRYKLDLDPEENNPIFESLRETSPLYLLAGRISSCVSKDETLTLNDKLMQQYHGALVKEVFDVIDRKGEKRANFNKHFLDNTSALSKEAKLFRSVFQRAYADMSKAKDSNCVWQELGTKELKLSKTFGEVFHLIKDPQITDPKNLAMVITNEMEKNKFTKVVQIRRETAKTGIIKDNIEKLAGHLLVLENQNEKEQRIRFSTEFFKTNNLPGNLNDFKTHLLTDLVNSGIQLTELPQYTFKINNFHTCEYNQVNVSHTLPSDEAISTKVIKQFFNDLVFAVNQPNEEELSGIIAKEIGREFNLADSQFLADYMQRKMLDWFKEKGKEKGKEGRFLSHEEGSSWIQEVKQKCQKLITLGPSLLYRTEIENLSVAFKLSEVKKLKVGEFLNSNDEKVFIITSKHTKLNSLKVLQALREIRRFRTDDSYMIMSLSTLENLEERVIEAFHSETCNLLVVDCNSEKLYSKTLINNLSNVIENRQKHIILLSEALHELCRSFKDSGIIYRECNEEDFFCGLTPDSQSKVLQMKVLFQGLEVKLEELVGASAEKVVDASTLEKLLCNEKVYVGKKLESTEEFRSHYIDRILNQNVEIKEEVFNDKLINDIFAISGMEECKIRRLAEGEKIMTYHINQSEINTSCRFYIIGKGENSERQFEELCKDRQGRDVHWLSAESGCLLWKKTRGRISKLRRYVSTKTSNVQQPGNVTDIIDRFMIISAEPGMGKTTLLAHLAQKTKESHPSLWIVRVNLNDHTSALSQLDLLGDVVNKVFEFLSNILELKHSLEINLFKVAFRSTGKCIVLFDGYDEICPMYSEKVTEVLQILEKNKLHKIWLTTRPHLEDHLENEFSVLSYGLQPLPEEVQKEFLRKFWKIRLHYAEKDIKKVESFIVDLMTLVSQCIDDRQGQFMSIPLQIRIVAEAFEENLGYFLNATENKPALPEKIDILWLYNKFIEIKFIEIYCKEKKKDDLSKVAVIEDNDETFKIFLTNHKRAALFALFSEETLKEILYRREMKEFKSFFKDKVKKGKERKGIIIGVTEYGIPRFIHKTFAEYFAAFWFAECVDNRNHRKNFERISLFLRNTLFKDPYKVMTLFFNRKIAYGSAIHTAVLNNDFKETERLIADIDQRDKGGRTALHLAASYNQDYAVKILLKENSNVNAKDTIFQWSPLQYAITAPYWGIAEQLLEKGANGDEIFYPEDQNINNFQTVLGIASANGYMHLVRLLIEQNIEIYFSYTAFQDGLISVIRNDIKADITSHLLKIKGLGFQSFACEGKGLLFLAAFFDQLNIVKYLVEEKDFVVDHSINDALFAATFHGNLDVMKYLKHKGTNFGIANKAGTTPLHVAASTGDVNVMTFLINEAKDKIDSCDEDGRTPLFLAVENGHLELIKYLITQSNAKTNITDIHGRTLLIAAAEKSTLSVFKYLLDVVEIEHDSSLNNYCTLLQTAVKYGTLDIVMYLIEDKKVDSAVSDSEGKSLLHMASEKGQLNIVRYLIENRSTSISTLDNNGHSSLFLAAQEENWDIVIFLLEHSKFNVNSPTEKDFLQLVVNSTEWELMKILAKKGFNSMLTIVDYMGDTLLHKAVGNGKLELAKALIANGADLKMKNSLDNNVFQHAVIFGHLDIVKYLFTLESITDHVVDSNLLHYAACFEHLEVIEYIILETGMVEPLDCDNLTPLHWAAQNGRVDVIKSLARFGANVNALDGDNDTPLHWAVDENKVMAVQTLLELGGDCNIKNKNGKTPLELAESKSFDDIIIILRNVNSKMELST